VPAVGTPPTPRPCRPAGGSQPPGQLALVEAPRPEPRRGKALEPHGARLAARLGLGDAAAGRYRHQAADPGLIDSDLVDKVLRALELGLDRADELPELCLGRHEFESPSDLPAG
ncbi:CITE1 protein, partial [Cnemophilus loriae]|nr:CITE1 protein [Cnemophilus loriae]